MRVLLVEDSAALRQRLVALLTTLPEIEIIGVAEEVPQALESIQRTGPDVVILDIRLRCGTGIDVLRNTPKHNGAPVIIVLTSYPYPQYRRRCMSMGADFFFDKSSEFDQVLEGMKRLAQGACIR